MAYMTPEPGPSIEPAPQNDPAECVDPPIVQPDWKGMLSATVRPAVAKLSGCAENARVPSNLQLTVHWRSDGSVERVAIERSSTKDCEAVECVRRKLAQVKTAPLPRGGTATLTVSFALRKHPPPDADEVIAWNPALDSPVCLDEPEPSKAEAREIQAAVRARYERFRKCYEAGLGRNPRLIGLLSLQASIDPMGKVSNVSAARNELADCDVVSCVKDAFRNIKFTPPGRTISIVYPLKLESK